MRSKTKSGVTKKRKAKGKPRALAAMVEDITLQKRMERLIHTQRDLALALNRITSLDSGLRLCIEAALDLSEMAGGGVYLLDDDSAALDLVVHQGLSSEFVSRVSHFGSDSARHIKVRVHKVKDEVQVVVEDDGVGLDPAVLDRSADPQRGLGLFNVKERLEYLMGRVEIHSSPGQGTTVTLAAPFKTVDRDRSKAKEPGLSRAESREPETRT